MMDYDSSSLYDRKLYGEIRHMITGFSGSRATFELFQATLRDSVSEYTIKNNNGLSRDKSLLLVSEVMRDLDTKYHRYDDKFEALIALGGKDGPAELKFFHSDGRFETVSTTKAIGTGSSFGSLFLHRIWYSGMTMKQVAEMGYFIIRFIEEFGLDHSVGLANLHPQVWCIPNHSDNDYELNDDDLNEIETKTKERVRNTDYFITSIFPFGVP